MRDLIVPAVILCLLMLGAGSARGEISWDTYETGMEKAKGEGKPVVLDFGTDWCTYCEKMHDESWPDARVQAWNGSFVFIEIDGDSRSDLTRLYDVDAYPTVIYLDDKGGEIGRTVGFRDAADLSHDLGQAYGYYNGSISDPDFSRTPEMCGLLFYPGALALAGLPLTGAVAAGRRFLR